MGKIVIAGAVLFVGIVVLSAGLLMVLRPPAASAPVAVAPVVPTVPEEHWRDVPAEKPREVVIAGPRTIWEEYARNEVGADNKFRDKRVQLVAVINGIRKDATDTITVDLAAQVNGPGTIDARFDESWAGDVGKMDRGELVSLNCKGIGMSFGKPHLGDCEVLWSQPKDPEFPSVVAASYELCAADRPEAKQMIETGTRSDGGTLSKAYVQKLRKLVSDCSSTLERVGAARLPCEHAAVEAMKWCDGDWGASTICSSALLRSAKGKLHYD